MDWGRRLIPINGFLPFTGVKLSIPTALIESHEVTIEAIKALLACDVFVRFQLDGSPSVVIQSVIHQHEALSMSIRTVRLDNDAEATLATLQKQTGLSISNVLKRGLETFAMEAREKTATKPYEVFRRLDLGPGSYAVGPAANAKDLASETIRKKYGR